MMRVVRLGLRWLLIAAGPLLAVAGLVALQFKDTVSETREATLTDAVETLVIDKAQAWPGGAVEWVGRVPTGWPVTVVLREVVPQARDATEEPYAGHATAEPNGVWSLDIVMKPEDGPRAFRLAANRSDGAPLGASGIYIVAPFNAGEPALVAIMGESLGAASSSLMTQAPASPATAPELAITSVDFAREAGDTIFAGVAQAGANLRLYMGGRFVGETLADGDGRWRVRTIDAIRSGRYTLRLDRIGHDGVAIARCEAPFERVDPNAALGTRAVVAEAKEQYWRVAMKDESGAARVAVFYDLRFDQTRAPDTVQPGQLVNPPGL